VMNQVETVSHSDNLKTRLRSPLPSRGRTGEGGKLHTGGRKVR
jgi:hypothetical protein